MTQHFSDERRLVLRLAASTAILAAAPATLVRPTMAAGLGSDLATRLARLIPHVGSAARIGSRYLALVPAEANPERILAAILDGQEELAVAAVTIPDRVLHRHIGECRQRDFLDGNTVSVDGWILSRTEARLCALVALQGA